MTGNLFRPPQSLYPILANSNSKPDHCSCFLIRDVLWIQFQCPWAGFRIYLVSILNILFRSNLFHILAFERLFLYSSFILSNLSFYVDSTFNRKNGPLRYLTIYTVTFHVNWRLLVTGGLPNRQISLNGLTRSCSCLSCTFYAKLTTKSW